MKEVLANEFIAILEAKEAKKADLGERVKPVGAITVWERPKPKLRGSERLTEVS